MKPELEIAKYSFGMGDRFAHQAKPQLLACMLARQQGVEITPVWNKSSREHTIVGSKPADVRKSVEEAISALSWTRAFHIDADHITIKNVDGFLESSDFFTLDVADSIGKSAQGSQVEAFLARHPELFARLELRGVQKPLTLSPAAVAQIAGKYLNAVQEAARVYRHIAGKKTDGRFITEVSMDETDLPQTPAELLVILAALADEGVPVQTIAPKFTGRFNKGVDYVGDCAQFETEFRADVAIVQHAVQAYGLPGNLKLSIHSGSDKFSIYPAIARVLREFDAGIHVKTAGTTWLEEVIGIAEAGGRGLELAKEIYVEAYAHREDLCSPYATVIDIEVAQLPTPAAVCSWTAEQFANALRHDQRRPEYNRSLRQLIHVGYKVAARLGKRYLDMLDACEETIARNVNKNLYERHIKPIFLSKGSSTSSSA